MDNDGCQYALHVATSNAEQEEKRVLYKPLAKCTRDERVHRAKLQKRDWMQKNNNGLLVYYLGEPIYVNC